MSETPNLSLPLLAAAQAQKHVTVNEALLRLDALAAPSVVSLSLASPPTAVEGDAYIVAAGATDDWSGRENELAFWVNDGWSFASPRPGWRVWVTDQSGEAVFSGTKWISDLSGSVLGGAYSSIKLLSGDETLSGTTVVSALTIPDRAVVLGVTARVLQDISGSGVTGWRVGVAGFPDRYGSGIGLIKDSTVNGITGGPVGYFGDTPLELTAEGGAFAGGDVRLVVHYLSLTTPDAI